MKLTLKQWRLIRGMTQAQLAEALEVTPVTIWKWEHTGNMSAKKLQAAAKVLEVSTDDIILP